jgi:hypothetical protein
MKVPSRRVAVGLIGDTAIAAGRAGRRLKGAEASKLASTNPTGQAVGFWHI